MFGKLDMELKTEDSQVSYQKASLFHGVLMEKISTAYAEKLHTGGLNPYSQTILNKDGKKIWRICVFNEEAYQKILLPLEQEDFSVIKIKHHQMEIPIVTKQRMLCDEQEFIEKYYFTDGSRYIKIRFCTPTAFKKNGKYVFYPDIRCIYQSLMRKYDSASEKISMCGEETLEQLEQHTDIIQYHLNSVSFPMEGVKIPSFLGVVLLKIRGPQAMVNLANLLFQFGTYSGIGIKTSIGMGAIEIVPKEGTKQ